MPTPLIIAKNLTLGYDKSHPVLEHLSFEIGERDFIGISGPNGGGKTTLIRTILGLLKPLSGELFRAEGKLSMGYMPQQNRIDRKFPISAARVAESGLIGMKLGKEERRRQVETVLEKVGMQTLGDRPIGELSGGQLQRILLARAIISRPRLLVLDEPDSFIDSSFREKLYELLPELNLSGAILLVSHDETALRALPRRIFHIARDFSEEVLSTYQ